MTTPNPQLLAKYAELYDTVPALLQYSVEIVGDEEESDGGSLIREPTARFYPTMPRELRAMALRFLAEAHETGADEGFLRYAKHSLEDPELATLYAGGLDEEGRPMTAEEQRDDYEAVIDGLRLIMKRRLARARANG